ncbi:MULTISPECIES: MFS transporter [Streptomyces]|uniref:MFS transporter n=3 Tax=Streptomyces TaxID=1883 RepID=A0ABP6PMQ7_9ACTN|nr:MFS transporter [Streptomyces calvus]MBA8946373.1 MFS family permease [Streptomyces calvus]MBA8980154.1 MFS family permease [Streptomyces calvus]QDI67268.1 MFS transporter [Streptomyces calvus]GGP73842.1 MFS transporter [Streptomyces calvus]
MSTVGQVTPGAPPGAATAVSGKDAGRVAFASFVGTALEWYDYFLFGTASAIVFNRLYFTTLNPTAATLAAFATFGVGFAARPIGALVFGWLGDRMGRKPALLITVVMIGAATGLIGLLPGYATIGIAAPLLLVLLRLVQGIAVGGEWGGAITLAVEHAPPEKRGWYAALPQVGSPVGTLLSSGAFALVLLLPSDAFDAWGWRLPFLIAFPLMAIAVYIRRRVEESPLFDEMMEHNEQAKVPALDVFRKAWGRLLVAMASATLGVGGFYMLTTFMISYGTDTLGLSRSLMVNGTLVAAVVEIAVIIVVGRMADRLGPGRVTLWGGLLSAVFAFPLFWLVETRNPFVIVLAMATGVAVLSIAYAVSGALLAELFPAQLRYTGVALSYNLAGALTGFLPFLATALLAAGGGASWPAALLLMTLSLITALGGFLGGRMRVRDNVAAA